MYYEILKYFYNKQDLSSLLNKIIDYKENKNQKFDLEYIKNLLIKFYLKNQDKAYKKQEISNISNFICNKIIK